MSGANHGVAGVPLGLGASYVDEEITFTSLTRRASGMVSGPASALRSDIAPGEGPCASGTFW